MGQAMREMLSKSKLNYPTVLWPICNLYAFSSVKCIHTILKVKVKTELWIH